MAGTRTHGVSGGRPPKLLPAEIQAILRAYANRVQGHPTMFELGEQYQVHQTTIKDVVGRRTHWRVPIPEDVLWYYQGLAKSAVYSEREIERER